MPRRFTINEKVNPMLQQSARAVRRLAMFVLPVAALLAQDNAFDPAIFKAPPAMYRGHAEHQGNRDTWMERLSYALARDYTLNVTSF